MRTLTKSIILNASLVLFTASGAALASDHGGSMSGNHSASSRHQSSGDHMAERQAEAQERMAKLQAAAQERMKQRQNNGPGNGMPGNPGTGAP